MLGHDKKSIVCYDWDNMPDSLPYGAVIATADLVFCKEITANQIMCWRTVYGENEIEFGDYTIGRYAWILANVRKIDPVPARGMQRIWNWDGEQV